MIFLNTEGDVLDAAQEAAFQTYIESGGGFAGVHSAANTEAGWAFYGTLLGTRFQSQSSVVQATVKVADHVQSSTAGLPDRWVRTDQWFNFTTNPRGDVHVLATVDESTFVGGVDGFDHPITWYRYVGNGRSWYTGLGHTEASYTEPLFLDHLLGGIQFAAGQVAGRFGCGNQCELAIGRLAANPEVGDQTSTPVLENPVSLAVAPSGEVFVTELWTGKLKVYDPSTGMFTVAADLDVFRQPGSNESQGNTEDGLTGVRSIRVSP